MFRLLFQLPLFLSLFTASVGYSANRIASGSVQIDSPLSEADVASIKALPHWPKAAINLTKTATPEAFASLKLLPELQELHLASGNSGIRDLAPVASLPGLRTIHFNSLKSADQTPVSVAPLARCSELSKVNFHGTPITDLNALAACGKLRDVSLYMADADSLDFLASTPDVRALDLYGFGHTFPGYEPVAKLTKLRELNIYMNKQATDRNLSVLKKLTSLRVMRMANCKEVGSLDFLANCTELEELHANWARKLADIGALARMPYLVEIDLSDALITDIAPLADKIYLARLDISKTKVSDLSPLRRSAHLERLDISETATADLSPLAGMRLMQILDIRKTSVADIAPLKGMRELRQLNLSRSNVTDLSPLLGLEKLSRITLSGTVPEAQITALKAALPELTVVFD